MVAAFPLGKLLYLGVRQISKPIAKQLQNVAVRSPLFRRYVCAPPAHALHYLEVFVKMRLMGLSGPAEYQPLREERAVQLGSEIIGEVFLYSVAASFLLYEYYRSVRKDQERDDLQDLKLVKIQERLKALDKEMNDMKAKVQVLQQNKTDSKSSQNKRS